MDRDYLILMTMARCSIDYDTAKKIVISYEKQDKLEEYSKIIADVQNYGDLKKYL